MPKNHKNTHNHMIFPHITILLLYKKPQHSLKKSCLIYAISLRDIWDTLPPTPQKNFIFLKRSTTTEYGYIPKVKVARICKLEFFRRVRVVRHQGGDAQHQQSYRQLVPVIFLPKFKKG